MLCDWKLFSNAPQTFHNTPCCWSIYVCGLNIALMKKKGLKAIEEEANAKSKMLYDFVDGSDGYFSNPIELKYRSRTNIPFRVKCDVELETKFIKEA
jgi:phosphoserine aminotransferase